MTAKDPIGAILYEAQPIIELNGRSMHRAWAARASIGSAFRASRRVRNQEPSWAPGLRGCCAAGRASRREGAAIVGLASSAFASIGAARSFR